MSAKLLPMTMAGLLAVAAAPALGETAGTTLSARLSGSNEVDAQGVGGKGDVDGGGSFSGRLADGKLCYALSASGIDAPTMAHIHSGASGKNGGVFVALPELGAGEHCVAVDEAKAAALSGAPGDYYVNIHNAAFPAGAVRGQLEKK